MFWCTFALFIFVRATFKEILVVCINYWLIIMSFIGLNVHRGAFYQTVELMNGTSDLDGLFFSYI